MKENLERKRTPNSRLLRAKGQTADDSKERKGEGEAGADKVEGRE